ncbi:MAG: SDR family oxidoreductase [Acidimicrobiales bacterium]
MILVAGGTGRLGTLVVERLLHGGLPVRVLTRDPQRAAPLGDRVSVMTGDVRDRRTLTAAFEGVEVVVSAVHGFVGPGGVSPTSVDRDGNANLTDAAKAAGADLVLMSIVGVTPNSPMELFRMKYAAEQHAMASGVPTTIIRATAFLELWIELLRHTATRSGRPLVFGRGDNPINFVSVIDVAALVTLAITDTATRGDTLGIGGPDDLTFNRLAQAVQSADGRTGTPRHVPPAMLRLAAATIGRLKPQIRRQTLAAVAMDTTKLSFDATATRARYPDLPCTSLTDLLSPAGNADPTATPASTNTRADTPPGEAAPAEPPQ